MIPSAGFVEQLLRVHQQRVLVLGKLIDFFVQEGDLGFGVDAGFKFDVGTDAVARAGGSGW